jgi:hypothetical protein
MSRGLKEYRLLQQADHPRSNFDDPITITRLNKFTSTYEFVNRSAETNQRELESWAELSMIVGPGRTFDSSSEAGARLALSHARFLGREMGLLSGDSQAA